MKIACFAQPLKWSARSILFSISCFILLHSPEGGVTNAAIFQPENKFKVTTVYLVRHAEKAAEPAADPPLLESGIKRAEELARMLGKAGIKSIYTSQYLRAKQTAEPLAKQLGISPTVIPVRMGENPRELSPHYLTEMANRVYSNTGGAVLIVGHSNTIPKIIKALGGDISPAIDETVFDDLFVVTLYAKGKGKVAHLKQ
ncbi:MAG TPA: phosphoglycerate mutase family protein [Blastocatellia bacterium]|nr:phosphoglycerate mutase family protein [Blastocatellia bacterium]